MTARLCQSSPAARGQDRKAAWLCPASSPLGYAILDLAVLGAVPKGRRPNISPSSKAHSRIAIRQIDIVNSEAACNIFSSLHLTCRLPRMRCSSRSEWAIPNALAPYSRLELRVAPNAPAEAGGENGGPHPAGHSGRARIRNILERNNPAGHSGTARMA